MRPPDTDGRPDMPATPPAVADATLLALPGRQAAAGRGALARSRLLQQVREEIDALLLPDGPELRRHVSRGARGLLAARPDRRQRVDPRGDPGGVN